MFKAWVDRVEGRKIFVSRRVPRGRPADSEADGIFITVDRAKFEQLLAERQAKAETS